PVIPKVDLGTSSSLHQLRLGTAFSINIEKSSCVENVERHSFGLWKINRCLSPTVLVGAKSFFTSRWKGFFYLWKGFLSILFIPKPAIPIIAGTLPNPINASGSTTKEKVVTPEIKVHG